MSEDSLSKIAVRMEEHNAAKENAFLNDQFLVTHAIPCTYCVLGIVNISSMSIIYVTNLGVGSRRMRRNSHSLR